LVAIRGVIHEFRDQTPEEFARTTLRHFEADADTIEAKVVILGSMPAIYFRYELGDNASDTVALRTSSIIWSRAGVHTTFGCSIFVKKEDPEGTLEEGESFCKTLVLAARPGAKPVSAFKPLPRPLPPPPPEETSTGESL
jgi:hypothetical protein